MPALGMAQETGKLVRWLKREGDQVIKGEPLMEVETDKATVEVESPASGTLAAVGASEGDDIAVGRPIAWILAQGDPTPASSRPVVEKVARAPQPPEHSIVRARPAASPKARQLAAERGVDLSKVVGSGPGGAVLEEDVLQSGDSGAVAEPAIWRAMAENVSRSWKQAPHFYVMREVDASRLVEERSQQPEGVTYTDLLVKAVATALVKHPRMNGRGGEINIGIAVAVTEGLIVPVVHGADALSVTQTSARRHELLERVRAGKLRSSDLIGGTFTISNLGMFGVDLFTAILPEGQAGILAVGRIADRVVARDGVPTVRPTMLMSLSCDHRRVDGARAAGFIQTLVALLEAR